MIYRLASRWLFAGLVTVLLFAAGTRPPGGTVLPAGESYALVIGAGNGDSAGESFAAGDALAVSEALSKMFGPERVLTLAGNSAAKPQLSCAINSWLDSRETENDTVFIFLAGHGNRDYLELNGSQPGGSPGGLSASELSSWLGALESRNIGVFMDFCGSGSFGEKLVNPGRVIFTAGSGGEQCWEDEALRHGVFTGCLLEILESPSAADSSRNGSLPADEIYRSVSNKMREHFASYPAPSSQHPDMFAGSVSVTVLKY
jgi:hypothetical protein